MNHILLQIAEPGLLQRIADQSLTLALLAVIASILWKRQKELEDKLTRYMDADRKTMMDVIQKNTAAFEKVNDHLDAHSKQ